MTEPTRDTAPPGTPGPTLGGPDASLAAQLQALWRELPGLVSDRVELLSPELQRAVQALAQIAALLVAVLPGRCCRRAGASASARRPPAAS